MQWCVTFIHVNHLRMQMTTNIRPLNDDWIIFFDISRKMYYLTVLLFFKDFSLETGAHPQYYYSSYILFIYLLFCQRALVFYSFIVKFFFLETWFGSYTKKNILWFLFFLFSFLLIISISLHSVSFEFVILRKLIWSFSPKLSLHDFNNTRIHLNVIFPKGISSAKKSARTQPNNVRLFLRVFSMRALCFYGIKFIGIYDKMGSTKLLWKRREWKI